MARDYYAVLEVGVGASSTQIRRAYQRLARRYSPDVNLWERDTQSLFEEIVQAYRVLSDPTARSVYDRQGGRESSRPERPSAGESPAGRRGDDATVAIELAFAQSATGLATNVPVERSSACETWINAIPRGFRLFRTSSKKASGWGPCARTFIATILS